MKTQSILLLVAATILVIVAIFGVERTSSQDGARNGWLPIAISLVSLAASAYTVWSTRLAPFKPSVEIGGRVYLSRGPPALAPMIKLPLAFTNSGADPGFVDDVAIEVRPMSKPDEVVVFSSFAEDVKPTLNIGPLTNAPPPGFSIFGGVYLTGGQSVTKVLCFLPFDSVPQPAFEYVAGRFKATVLTRHGKSSEWVVRDSVDFTVDATDVAVTAKPAIPPGGGMVTVGEQIKFNDEQFASLAKLVSSHKK